MQPEVTRIHADLCDLYDRNHARALDHYREVYAGTELRALLRARTHLDEDPDTGRKLTFGHLDIHDRAWRDGERDVLNELIEEEDRKEMT